MDANDRALLTALDAAHRDAKTSAQLDAKVAVAYAQRWAIRRLQCHIDDIRAELAPLTSEQSRVFDDMQSLLYAQTGA